MNKVLLNTKYNLSELSVVANQLTQLNQKIILFDAPMGAGKTTLIKEICKQLGSTDNFSSPTYQLVNEYIFPKGKIYHFDLYRLKSLEELIDIGFEDYISLNNYCFIEWPDFAQVFLQTNFIKVEIKLWQDKRDILVVEY
ncbi:MAG: tRNA (adenosine(37)-N6)-threonylcarbamoyltransferase complex ATPase subunit type 1 TsaE [Bacteroidota bacterium]|nr:tRNA (adenosine(37)-N6)-threonylcarbamoyltransferase complex ATPase subunit type 1 TsaE [Bacteroidota bacterium]